jgi:hypothetical protein
MVESIPDGEDFTGDGRPSGDFSHFAFSSNDIPFAAGGLESAPGSAYDNDTAANTAEIISIAAGGGGDIAQDPGGCTLESGKQRQCSSEFIQFPAISRDGSHILMSNWAPPLEGKFPPEPFAGDNDAFQLQDIHMTMRVDDALSYDVTRGFRGNFVGMTNDGSRVFYTSDEQVTADDNDESIDLFMWSEAGDEVTRVSAGTAGTGDTDSCSAGWTGKCSIQPISSQIETDAENNEILTPDNWVAGESGDVYFYSPEQLDGSQNGAAGLRNLYAYRNGKAQFLAKLSPSGPAKRINATPDGDRVAILTSSQLSGYDNEGHPEVYTIDADVLDPGTQQPLITCVSCNPTGAPPTGVVRVSGNGIFLTDDGRTFFSTTEALVPFDTDGIRDVYEYVQGRPQLITSGTAQQDTWGGGLLLYPPMTVGLEGVSSDGTDVYFTTFETLTSQDENGEFIKVYDARSGGGFPSQESAPPCKAADECHGAGSVSPPPPQVGTGASLGTTGNHPKKKKCKKGRVKKHGKCVSKKKKSKRHHKRHHKSQGGKRNG